MKRSTPLTRRTPLTRGGPLARTPLAKISPRKRRELRESRPVVQAVFDRDGACILRGHAAVAGPCFGGMTPHHLRKQSAERGGWSLDNLVTLCAGHNDGWVEDHPPVARRLGLVVTRGETTRDAWDRMVAAGLPVTAPRGDAA